tara:strand:+ start:61 stop:381 length:321 start_codon:yes stop_codon:yes gene_type:complete
MDVLIELLSRSYQLMPYIDRPVIRPIPEYSKDMNKYIDMEGIEWIEVRVGEWLKKNEYLEMSDKLCITVDEYVSYITIAEIMDYKAGVPKPEPITYSSTWGEEYVV